MDPTTPPVPPVNKSLQEKVKQLTETVDEISMASTIAGGYREMAKQIDDGKVVTKQQAVDAMAMFFDQVLRPQLTTKKDLWEGWEVDVNAELSALQDAGSLNGTAELSAAYKSIVAGIEDTGAAAIDLPLNIELIQAILTKDIAKIVAIILQLIANRGN